MISFVQQFLSSAQRYARKPSLDKNSGLLGSDRGGCMNIWNVKSAPAQREARVCAAKEIIDTKCRLNSKRNRKSYAITSRDGETDREIRFFGKRGFSRG